MNKKHINKYPAKCVRCAKRIEPKEGVIFHAGNYREYQHLSCREKHGLLLGRKLNTKK